MGNRQGYDSMDGAELAMCGGLLELGNHNQYMKNHYMCYFCVQDSL